MTGVEMGFYGEFFARIQRVVTRANNWLAVLWVLPKEASLMTLAFAVIFGYRDQGITVRH